MSDPLSPPLASRLIELVTAGGAGALLLALVNAVLNRKSQAASIHLTNAQTDKAEAERDASTIEMALKLARELSTQIEGLRAENDKLRQENAILREMKKPGEGPKGTGG